MEITPTTYINATQRFPKLSSNGRFSIDIDMKFDTGDGLDMKFPLQIQESDLGYIEIEDKDAPDPP